MVDWLQVEVGEPLLRADFRQQLFNDRAELSYGTVYRFTIVEQSMHVRCLWFSKYYMSLRRGLQLFHDTGLSVNSPQLYLVVPPFAGMSIDPNKIPILLTSESIRITVQAGIFLQFHDREMLQIYLILASSLPCW